MSQIYMLITNSSLFYTTNKSKCTILVYLNSNNKVILLLYSNPPKGNHNMFLKNNDYCRVLYFLRGVRKGKELVLNNRSSDFSPLEEHNVFNILGLVTFFIHTTAKKDVQRRIRTTDWQTIRPHKYLSSLADMMLCHEILCE